MKQSAEFLAAEAEVISIEGGYSNHPNDPGGRTMWGITERDYPELWKDGRPTRAQALVVYHRDFWLVNRLDSIRNPRVQFEVFEAGVNCAPRRAAKFLQAGYNLARPASWIDIKVDGKIGPKTIRAINRLSSLNPSAETALLVAQNLEQGWHYKRQNNHAMIRGWLAKRVRLAEATD